MIGCGSGFGGIGTSGTYLSLEQVAHNAGGMPHGRLKVEEAGA